MRKVMLHEFTVIWNNIDDWKKWILWDFVEPLSNKEKIIPLTETQFYRQKAASVIQKNVKKTPFYSFFYEMVNKGVNKSLRTNTSIVILWVLVLKFQCNWCKCIEIFPVGTMDAWMVSSNCALFYWNRKIHLKMYSKTELQLSSYFWH